MVLAALHLGTVIAIGSATLAAGTAVAAGRVMLMGLDRADEVRALATGEGRRLLADAIERAEDAMAEVEGAMREPGRLEDGEVVVAVAAGLPAEQASVPVADLVHAAPGRLRLSLRRRAEGDTLADLADRLAALPGIHGVSVRETTGSVILATDLTPELLVPVLERAGLLRLAGDARPKAGAMAMGLVLDRLDAVLRLQSGGRADLKGLMALGLVAADIIRRDPAVARLAPRELLARVLAEARRRRDGDDRT